MKSAEPFRQYEYEVVFEAIRPISVGDEVQWKYDRTASFSHPWSLCYHFGIYRPFLKQGVLPSNQKIHKCWFGCLIKHHAKECPEYDPPL